MRKLILILAVTWISCSVFAGPTFYDDFESGDLSNWITSDPSYGMIVADPEDSSNNVLSFSNTNSAGDVFTTDLIDNPGIPVTIKFDYLGQGGFLGISYAANAADVPDDHVWLAGNDYTGTIDIDTDEWTPYSVTINPTGDFRIMIEDFRTADSDGDAYFDNIDVAPVPAPGAFLLGGIGLSIVGYIKRRRMLN